MGGASGKKEPYQRLELRPLRMWMAVSRVSSAEVGAVEVEAEGAGGFVLAVDDDDVGEAAAGGFEQGCESVG